jgi:hypothetical protein
MIAMDCYVRYTAVKRIFITAGERRLLPLLPISKTDFKHR